MILDIDSNSSKRDAEARVSRAAAVSIIVTDIIFAASWLGVMVLGVWGAWASS